jgi:hypothetical protein
MMLPNISVILPIPCLIHTSIFIFLAKKTPPTKQDTCTVIILTVSQDLFSLERMSLPLKH